MRAVLFYNAALFATPEEGDASVTVQDVKTFARTASEQRKGAVVLLRDAAMFSGNLEVHGNKHPDAVLLLGPMCDKFDEIGQAFDAVGVEVTHRHEIPAEEGSFPETPENADLPPETELTRLKARATELGLNFASNIGEAALRGRIAAKEKEIADLAPDETEKTDDDNSDNGGEGGESGESGNE